MLQARALVQTADPAHLSEQVQSSLGEFGRTGPCADGTEIVISFGRAVLRPLAQGLEIAIEARDESQFLYMKMAIREHVSRGLPQASEPISWDGAAITGRMPPFFREMRVAATHRLTPHMQRLRLVGDDLHRFARDGLHVRLLIPPRGREPIWPHLESDGRLVWADGADRVEPRIYTLRRVNPAEGFVEIDMVLHEGDDMPGTLFAANARPGDRVGMSGPSGGFLPDADALFLFGDETALPAIARILEARGPGTRTRAVIEVGDESDRMALETGGEAEIVWRVRSKGAGSLFEAVRASDWQALGPDPFVWAGCEFNEFRLIRSHLRKEHGFARERHQVVAYWRRGESGRSCAA